MSAANGQIKEILWKLIEKHYNVDRRQPQVLTAKALALGPNPIDQIGDSLELIIDELLNQAIDDFVQAQEEKAREEEYDDDTFGYWMD